MKKRLKLYVRCFFSLVHIAFVKIFNPRAFKTGALQDFSFGTRIIPEKNSVIKLGKKIHTKGETVFETMEGGRLEIGSGCVFNRGTVIVCADNITIGEKTAFGPNVMVYDHDHDTERTVENEFAYNKSPITIGKWVWIGANTVILRGSVIGDGCVIGAGSVIKGTYAPNTVIIQERTTRTRQTAVKTEAKGGEAIGSVRGEEEHTRLKGMVHIP